MRFSWIILATLLRVAASGDAASAQTERGQMAAGGIEGNVICADGNVPARGAKVVLIPLAKLLDPESKARETPAPEPQPTDFSGYYVFSSVAPGIYLVNVEQDGYADDFRLVRTVLDRFTPDERRKLLSAFPQVSITAGSTLRKELLIHRAASLAGHVSVDLGGTIPKSYVTATLVSSTLVGDLEGDSKDSDFSLKAVVDDRGAFRIPGLPSGKYRLSTVLFESYLSITQLPNKDFEMRPLRLGWGNATVFASETVVKERAKLFEVRDGDEITDADVTIPMSRWHSISGVITQNGVPIASALVHVEQEGVPWNKRDAVSGADGSFRLDFIPAGNYVLVGKVYASFGAKTTKEGHNTVIVGDVDILNIALELHDTGNKESR